jgi:hypothetical protein
VKKIKLKAVLMLSLATLGLYSLFWQARARTVLNKKTRVHIPSVLWLIVPLVITFISFIYYLIEQASNRPIATASNGSFTTTITSNPNGLGTATFILLASAFLLVSINTYWQFKFTEATTHYSKNRLNKWISLGLLSVFPAAGIGYIQNDFNGTKPAKYVEEILPELSQPVATSAPDKPLKASNLERAIARLAMIEPKKSKTQVSAPAAAAKASSSGQELRDRFRNYSPGPNSNTPRQLTRPVVIGL